jgi:hypothetical protein
VFSDAAVSKAQLLHVFKSLGQLIVWLKGFLEGIQEFIVGPPIRFISFCIDAFFDFCLDKLLFPNSCQSGMTK